MTPTWPVAAGWRWLPEQCLTAAEDREERAKYRHLLDDTDRQIRNAIAPWLPAGTRQNSALHALANALAALPPQVDLAMVIETLRGEQR